MITGMEIIHEDPDAPGAAAAVPAPALLVLDEDGEGVRAEELPADFPANARPSGDADGSFILTLRYPVKLKFRTAGVVSEENFLTLKLQRLNGKRQREIMTASGGDDYRAQVIATMAGLTLGRARLLHDAMDATDIAAVLRVMIFFTTPGRRAGP